MTGEDWVEAAMEDDSMVVEMLLGLSQTTAESKAALPLEWRVRQRRSKPVTVSAKKAAPRDSPNTPLSWSGGTSGSGGAVDGGPEESSRPPSGSKPARSARSKVNETSEKTATKRSRRKKTLAELKQEEVMLLKERRQLKKELAKIRVNLESQKATNENLKRMKLELLPQPQPQSESIATAASNQLEQKQETGQGVEDRIVLPDLNLPLEEDQMLLS